MEQTDSLLSEIDFLRRQLAEAQEALEAIRSGGVDALVVYKEGEEQVFTLQGAEQPYRVMLEAINEGAAVLSSDGLVIWGNASLAELLGRPLESILGAPLVSLITGEHQEDFQALISLAVPEKRKIELELQGVNGIHIPILLSISSLLDLEGVQTYCLILTDLTEHKRNVRLAEAERTARAIIDQAAEAIVVCDSNGIVVRHSQAAAHLAGQNPLFRHFAEVFPLQFDPSLPAGRRFSMEAVLAGEVFSSLEATLAPSTPGPAGRLFFLAVSATPLQLPKDETVGCVITMINLTERKRTEEAIKNYAHRLELSNKDLQDFAFIASHDLQEPLRKIQGFGNRLVEAYGPLLKDDGFEYIDRMQKAALRMEKMINSLLSYSRISSKEVVFEPVDLNKVARGVLSDLELALDQTHGQVIVDDLPVVEADNVQMRQLLQNLISNALKFHRQDVPPIVRVSSKPAQEGSVEICVEDNGIGFDMQYLDRVFQPFQRLHGRSQYEGSGIGLPICRRIVERHHGALTAQGQPGVGAVFTVHLPLKQSGSRS